MRRLALTFWISFIILLGATKCRNTDTHPTVDLITEDTKRVGLSIKGIHIRESEISKRLEIRLINEKNEHPAMLGEFRTDGDEIIFEPLVPFTSGLQYQILLDDSLLAQVEIPIEEQTAPELVSVYPTLDTVPENLLKIYLQFSLPMIEGRSLDHLTLLRSNGDTMQGTFLDLQPELWNAESTVLTLWLDPGRIKRDLIPNKTLGTPLSAGEKYILHVSPEWRSKNGAKLEHGYTKTFVASPRDDTPPDVSNWILKPPLARTTEYLEVLAPETIDYFLFQDAVMIARSDGERVTGDIKISHNERVYAFLPHKPWTSGKYTLQVEGRLEDLAGNNLYRPFDRDIENVREHESQVFFTKEFEIR